MAVALPHYVKIKDRYCVAYFGFCTEYLVQLCLLRPNVERELPGLRLYIASNDCTFGVVAGEERVLDRTTLYRDGPHEFAYVRELSCDMREHPVETFMEESGIPLAVPAPQAAFPARCVVLNNPALPSKPLSGAQLDSLVTYAQGRGYQVEVNGDWRTAGWVAGPETEGLFRAGGAGLKTTLVPTGLGERLYRKMFPGGEVLKI